MKKWLWAALVLALVVTGAGAENELFVQKADIGDAFIFGADISSVLSLEASGVVYKDADGHPADLFALLKGAGYTDVRVRVWVDPFDQNGNSYGGGGGSLENAVIIGRRAAENGLSLLVDFHYSDFWADPKKQQCPKAWQGMNIADKTQALYAYTKDALSQIIQGGASVRMVQLGNEIDSAMAGENSWPRIGRLLNAGAKAVREINKDILIAVHFSQPQTRFAKLLKTQKVDYDVFAASYYPYWHGTISNMQSVFASIVKDYQKKVVIAETAYLYTEENGDFHANSVPATGTVLRYAPTLQGQANALCDIVQAFSSIGESALGVYVWEPAWLPVPGDTFEAQSALWEAYGSGWASSYASEYDPNDAGLYYGGSSWDNQAFFDFVGNALPTLYLPKLLKTGSAAPLRIDSMETPSVTCYIDDGITLPDTINAVYNDRSEKAINAQWNQNEIAEAGKALGDYVIHGTADGRDVTCKLTVTAQNFLENPGFEDTDMSMWDLRNIDDKTQQLYRATSTNDMKSGEWLLHFYSTDEVCFEVSQTVENLREGEYDFSLYIHGGDAETQTMYIYALIDGEPYKTQHMGVTAWQEWQRPVIARIPVKQGQTLTVGAYVSAGSAKGPWGKLDDWMLNLSRD